MFTSFFSWLAGPFWNAIKGVWQTTWNVFSAGWFWITATVVGFIAITDHVSKFLFDAVVLATSAGVGLVLDGQDQSGHVNSLFSVVNLFFPLAEGFTLISAYSLLMLAAFLYRLIKSWIPTVA